MSAVSGSPSTSRVEAMQKALNTTTLEDALKEFRANTQEKENPVHQMIAMGEAKTLPDPTRALCVYDIMLSALRIKQNATLTLGRVFSVPAKLTLTQQAVQAISYTLGIATIPPQMQSLFEQPLPELDVKTKKVADYMINSTLIALQADPLSVRSLKFLEVQMKDPQFNHKWIERIVLPEITLLTARQPIELLTQA